LRKQKLFEGRMVARLERSSSAHKKRGLGIIGLLLSRGNEADWGVMKEKEVRGGGRCARDKKGGSSHAGKRKAFRSHIQGGKLEKGGESKAPTMLQRGERG